MKILLVNDYAEQFGGAEKYIYNLARLLSENGHKVKIFGSSSVRNGLIPFFSRVFSLRYYFKTKEIINKFRPDIIHVHNCARAISVSPVVAAKSYKLPVILTVHDFHYVCPKTWMVYADGNPCKYGFGKRCLVSNCYTFKTGYYYFPYHWLKWLKVGLHRQVLRKYVDRFICPSLVLTRWFSKSLHLRRVTWIPNFAETKIFHCKSIERFDRLLFVGRLSKEKGIEYLIRAMPSVIEKFSSVRLSIVGSGPERKKLEKITQSLRIEENVYFFGELQEKDLLAHYRQSTAVVVPSVWMENNPIVVFEAMSSGRPVIGSNIGGVSELIEHGKTGFYFKPGDIEDLAKTVIMLLNNRRQVLKMAENAKKAVEKIFSETKHLEKIESVYTNLLKS